MTAVEPMVPMRYRVAAARRETADTMTLDLDPVDSPIDPPQPGQFTMLYAFGAGEIPISVSGCPEDEGHLRHTIRGVGAVSRTIIDLPVGSMLGVRGPHGIGWAVELASGQDVIVVAGGIGLAPLRPVIRHIVEHREDYGDVAVLIGARRPDDVLYRDELDDWQNRGGLQLHVTVDMAEPGWDGSVGLVTQLIPRALVEPERTTAFVCGPEVMLRLVAQSLVGTGVAAARILVSLERNMQCAIGHCGHCQLGPLFVCTDGPVVSWSVAAPLLKVRHW